MRQKGNVLIGILVSLVIAGAIFRAYYLKTRNTSVQNTLLSSSVDPTTSSSPPPSSKRSWQKYKSGQALSGISIQYPAGWTANYRKESNLSSDYTAHYRLSFDFTPSGWSSPQSVDWMGWGQMSFDVYDPQTDIDSWLKEYLPKYRDGLLARKDANIGNKPTFRVEADSKKDWAIGWLPRDVILGTDFSYEVGYSQNGNEDFITVLKKEIFPTIKIN